MGQPGRVGQAVSLLTILENLICFMAKTEIMEVRGKIERKMLFKLILVLPAKQVRNLVVLLYFSRS